ncbi:hypothetical protein XENOCAPTIV_007635, partial [Xenoophorus captivus]
LAGVVTQGFLGFNSAREFHRRKKGKLVTASSNNTVQIHTFPDGDPDGILTRFTTNATHVAFNSSGSRVAAGSRYPRQEVTRGVQEIVFDFMVKVVEVSDSSQQKTLRGHEAPVLSVSFDPKDQYLASASCDGSVVVWNIEEQVRCCYLFSTRGVFMLFLSRVFTFLRPLAQTQVISWPLLQKTNDVSNARSLCRLAFQPAAGEVSRLTDTGSLKLGQDKFGDDDDGSSVAPAAAPLVPLRPFYEGPMPTPPQKAFQPGSTPAHLTHRFMVGRSDGLQT